MAKTPAQVVGSNVRAEMARKSMTQMQLAATIGIPQPSLSARLRGVVAFDVNELHAAARALNVRVGDLLVDEAPAVPA